MKFVLGIVEIWFETCEWSAKSIEKCERLDKKFNFIYVSIQQLNFRFDLIQKFNPSQRFYALFILLCKLVWTSIGVRCCIYLSITNNIFIILVNSKNVSTILFYCCWFLHVWSYNSQVVDFETFSIPSTFDF